MSLSRKHLNRCALNRMLFESGVSRMRGREIARDKPHAALRWSAPGSKR